MYNSLEHLWSFNQSLLITLYVNRQPKGTKIVLRYSKGFQWIWYNTYSVPEIQFRRFTGLLKEKYCFTVKNATMKKITDSINLNI